MSAVSAVHESTWQTAMLIFAGGETVYDIQLTLQRGSSLCNVDQQRHLRLLEYKPNTIFNQT